MKGLKVGAKVKCFIARVKIEDGTIQEKDGMFYICQNKIDGERCKDILGYKYSWRIGSGSAKELSEESVTNFKIIANGISKVIEEEIVSPRKLEKGMRISCKIQDTVIDDGVIQKEDNDYYICQNSRQGLVCIDKLGYSCSWIIFKGTKEDLVEGQITDLVIKDFEIKYVNVGDKVDCGLGKQKVLGICGEIIFLSYANDFDTLNGGYTAKILEKTGYKTVFNEDISEDAIAK